MPGAVGSLGFVGLAGVVGSLGFVGVSFLVYGTGVSLVGSAGVTLGVLGV